MRIGIAGPMSLVALELRTNEKLMLPAGYEFPLISWLINTLTETGHEVFAFTTSIDIERPLVVEAKGLTLCVCPSRRFHRGRDMYKVERDQLRVMMLEHKPDVIGAHWSYEFAWAALDTGIPTLVSLHDHAFTVLRYQPDMYRVMRLLMNYTVLRHAPWLSVNSHYLFSKLSRNQQRKARVIPNFFPPDMETCEKPYTQREYALVTIANGFGRRKNVHAAIEAFGILRKRYPGLRYYLIGDDMGPGEAAHAYAKKLGAEDGIVFVGRVPPASVAEMVSNARVLLHPSLEESFGMSVLEAMVLGTPVVGGKNSGNIPALLDSGNTGVLCDVKNSEEVALKVSTLLTDSARASALAQRAREFALDRFPARRIVNEYVEYLRQVANG